MIEIANGIWAHEDAMNMMGTKLRLRMMVIKLSSGELWVHSPTRLSAPLQQAVDALGTVKYIVGPSNGHHLSLSQWQTAYPDAQLYLSPGIPKKQPSLKGYQLLDEEFANIWAEDLDRDYMSGVPFFNESVFLHKASQSLIVTDLVQNHSDPRPPGLAGLVTRLLFEPMGFKGICVAPPLKMGFMIKDKQNFVTFLKRVQQWDFQRIIVAHGDIIDVDAKQVFSRLCERFFK